MRISYNWLKEYIDVKLPPERLAETLTMAGLSAESFRRTGADWIFELEITSNRPDWLSYVGVARELAALTGAKLKIPVAAKPRVKGQGAGVKVKVEDKKLCPRYTARVIRGVKVGASPAWLKERVEAMGLRSVNNVVDITNFCLFETGEPMHAFDLDKIAGPEVVVRRARDGEKIVTIDGGEKTLSGSVLVISDKDKPIAVAGVMGGLNTEVTLSTKNILLEAASFDGVSVRRAVRALGISTESSYRFERSVDIANITYSSDRAANLISELAGGEIGEIRDIGSGKEAAGGVSLRLARLEKVLGVEIDKTRVKRITLSLGLKLKSSANDILKFAVPGFRQDIHEEIDVIEEIARIYGYDKIPSTIPGAMVQAIRRPDNIVFENKIRYILAGLGACETVTYSLISKEALDMAGIPAERAVEIKNPLSAEQEVMRPDLIVGALDSILWNRNRKNKDLKLFEIGNIYLKESGAFAENKELSISVTGQADPDVLSKARPYGLLDLKGIVETLLSELRIKGYLVLPAQDPLFSPGACARIKIGGRAAGILGEVKREILGRFDIKDKVFFSRISIGELMRGAATEKKFTELPKYPSVQRDISIIAGENASNSEIIGVIREAAGAILKDVKLVDRYSGKQIPDGKVSLTYRLEYQDPAKTLEEKDVSAPHSRILQRLEEKFGARLR